MNKLAVVVISTSALVLAACGGATPNPVSRYQPGDENRSCTGIFAEISANEAEMAALLPHADATGKNVILGVAGAFFLVPWLFMDFKEGEAVDLKALKRRNAWLREVAVEKECKYIPEPTIVFEPPPTPSNNSCC